MEVSPIGQERFHAIDKWVMRHVFDIHNTMGRFCDERIYQDELVQRCGGDGLEVHREVQLRVCHKSFSKPYYLDMLVECGAIYELKAVEAFNNRHQAQLINYLLLAGLGQGKLVNFRPGSVESRFVSTRICRQERMTFMLDDDAWRGDDDYSRLLRDTLCELLTDWGVFLEASLYREALLRLLDGPCAGIQPIDVVVGGRVVGAQNMSMLCAGSVWHLSAVREHLRSYETHLIRLLSHTRLEQMHWINLDQQTVTLKTLRNNDFAKNLSLQK
jgi:GxxExxY protein